VVALLLIRALRFALLMATGEGLHSGRSQMLVAKDIDKMNHKPLRGDIDEKRKEKREKREEIC